MNYSNTWKKIFPKSIITENKIDKGITENRCIQDPGSYRSLRL